MPLNIAKTQELWERYVYARDHGHLDFVNKANMCEDYFYGNQWHAAHKRKLENQGKPVLTINKVFSTLITVMGEQLQNQASVGFLAKATGDPKTAEALNKIYLHSLAGNNRKEHRRELLHHGVFSSAHSVVVQSAFDECVNDNVDS